MAATPGTIMAQHWRAGVYRFQAAPTDEGSTVAVVLRQHVQRGGPVGSPNKSPFPGTGSGTTSYTGGHGQPNRNGTKAAWWYTADIEPGQTVEFRLRLAGEATRTPGAPPSSAHGFTKLMDQRRTEADEYYAHLSPPTPPRTNERSCDRPSRG